MSKLIGTWELIKSDGFDDFLKQLGKVFSNFFNNQDQCKF
jgi:hypothetical protein